MENPVLEIRNLSKSYGAIRALDGFSLKIEKGQVYGILGPNGSGKTTTLGIILDILKQDSGDFLWFGQQPDEKSRKRIGALLESPVFYSYLSGVKNLEIVADIKGLSYEVIPAALDKVGLLERRSSKFSTYSLGMKQRLAIAAALLGNPEVLILDEPTNGLDPKGIAEIRDLIVEVGKGGTTIILASHLLGEVQKVCSHVVILDKGKMLSEGSVSQALSEAAALELEATDMNLLEGILVGFDFVKKQFREDGKIIAELSRDISPDEVNRLLVKQGIYLTHLALRTKSLEKYFLERLSKGS